MTRERADSDAVHDAPADEVHDGELAAAGVGNERVPAVGRDRRVARFWKPRSTLRTRTGRPSSSVTAPKSVCATTATPPGPLWIERGPASVAIRPASLPLARREVKDALRAATDAAIATGVHGVPTLVVNGELFWGDDRLEDAAAAAAA